MPMEMYQRAKSSSTEWTKIVDYIIPGRSSTIHFMEGDAAAKHVLELCFICSTLEAEEQNPQKAATDIATHTTTPF